MRDLKTELREYIDGAADPVGLEEARSHPLEADARHSHLPFLVAAAAALMVVIAGAIVLRSPAGDRVEVVAPESGSTTSAPEGADVPSQTPAEATRDSVVPAVAELPVATRVRPVVRISAPEGVWVISRLGPDAGTADCVLGDPAGVYGRDRVCDLEYGEVLLLDASETRVLRAFPLPGLPPQALLVTQDAVYCGRQGDGGLPDSMLCRVDRRTFDWTVRAFPSSIDSGLTAPDRYRPASWIIDQSAPKAVFGELVMVDGVLLTKGPEGSVPFDRITLTLHTPRS